MQAARPPRVAAIPTGVFMSAEDRPQRFKRRPPASAHQGNRPGQRRPPAPRAVIEPDAGEIYGLHAVAAALANPGRVIKRVLASDNAARRLAEALNARGVIVDPVSPRDLDRRLGADTVHQGVLLETEPLAEPDFAELAATAAEAGPLVVLDQVTDPHNVGAVLRSGAAFGCSGLVMTRRNSPPLAGTLAKAASGALEVVPVALVQNLARALAELKESGFTLVGLDGGADGAIEAEPLAGPVALVLGAEGKGLRQLTRETCDRLARISTPGPVGSLNVSNAAAIALHLAALRRAGLPPFTPGG
jgi:23S rRNA (guanosine2251-2'-O)-methyltransferase